MGEKFVGVIGLKSPIEKKWDYLKVVPPSTTSV